MNKHSWSSEGFKEGLLDEGIPLGGATIGAGLSALRNKGGNPIMSGITGAALGYAGGSLASLARSRLRGEKKELTPSQKLLGLSGLGYGIGALTHTGVGRALGKKVGEHAAPKLTALGKKVPRLANVMHGENTVAGRIAEEALPATGAVLGAGIAEGTNHKPKAPKPGGKVVTSSISLTAFVDELNGISSELEKVAKWGVFGRMGLGTAKAGAEQAAHVAGRAAPTPTVQGMIRRKLDPAAMNVATPTGVSSWRTNPRAIEL